MLYLCNSFKPPIMSKNHFLLIISVLLFFQACTSTQKIEKPLESYLPTAAPESPSVLNIPVAIDLRSLETSLNQNFSGVLYEDNDLNDGDNMMLRAERIDAIKIGFREGFITYSLPLSIWVRYNLGISKVEAKGSIMLDFETTYDINPDWQFQTNTVLLRHQWIVKPSVKLIGIQIPAGFIADILLKYSKDNLAAAIDEQIAGSFDLRGTMETTWKQMFEPMLVSETYQTWLQVNPVDIGMSPLQLRGDTLTGTLMVTSMPTVILGEKPALSTPSPLPAFDYRQPDTTTFQLHLKTAVTYADAEQLLKQELLGSVFSQGSKSVTLEDISLYGRNDRLVVELTLSGAYQGGIYLEGTPVFNKARNTIDIDGLEFTLNTRNVLFKTGSWLLKSTIKSEIQENLDFLLAYNLNDMREQIQIQLQDYPVTKDVTLQGNLDAFEISDAFLSPQQMVVWMTLRGKAQILVKGLN